jgi:hypothetical protein
MDGKTMIPTDRINEWEVNARSREISKEDYYLLREKLEKKSQYKPLIVTPASTPTDIDGMPLVTYICLAGNHRLRAYKDMGVEEVWVTIITFVQKEDGLFYAERDGVLEKERYITLEDGMLDWALTDNEEFASYDKEFFANEASNYNLDWNKYLISDTPHVRLSTIMDKYKLTGDEQQNDNDGPKEVECPECHARFTPKYDAANN